MRAGIDCVVDSIFCFERGVYIEAHRFFRAHLKWIRVPKGEYPWGEKFGINPTDLANSTPVMYGKGLWVMDFHRVIESSSATGWLWVSEVGKDIDMPQDELSPIKIKNDESIRHPQLLIP